MQFTKKKKFALGQKLSDKLNKLNPRGLQCFFLSLMLWLQVRLKHENLSVSMQLDRWAPKIQDRKCFI